MRTSLMESAPTRSQTHPNIPRRITHPNIPRRITHPDLPKGKELVTRFVKDFSKSILPMNISPHLTSPEGEGQLLLLLIND